MRKPQRRRLTKADFNRKPEPMPHATLMACPEHATARTVRKVIGQDGTDADNERFVNILACWRCWEINPETSMTRIMDLLDFTADAQAEVVAFIRQDKLNSQKRSGQQK